MKEIYTKTNATFTTAKGETISYQDVFDSVRKSVEIYGKKGDRCLPQEDLEDLFQNTVIKTLEHCGKFDSSRAKLSTWVRAIVHNAYVDAVNKHNTHRDKFTSIVDEDGKTRIKEDPYGYSANREVEENEAVARIRSAIGSLNEKYRLIIQLQSNGMRSKDMAPYFNCTVAAASILLCRARKALKRTLGERFLAEYGILE